MDTQRRLVAVLAALPVALSLAALASLAPGSPLSQGCAGAGSRHAALVVEHGDGSIVTRCVAFDSAAITGEQLLDASGVAWSGQTFGGYGAAVCALDGEPAHYATCPGKDYYWALFVSRGGGPWQLSGVGISSLSLADGDAEGFRYVPATGTPPAPPAPAGVCGSAAGSGGVAQSTAAISAAASASDAAAAPSGGGSESPGVATAGATETAAGGTGGPHDSGAAGPTSGSGAGSGIDLGLLAAAVAGGGLAGLALLRLAAARRRAS